MVDRGLIRSVLARAPPVSPVFRGTVDFRGWQKMVRGRSLSTMAVRANSSWTSPRKDLHTLGVVGVGQMGTGICLTAAKEAALRVVAYDITEDKLDKSRKVTEERLRKYVTKGVLSQEAMDSIAARITFSSELDSLGEADYVVEAATEQLDVKLHLFERLNDVTGPDVILASNTSSISISSIASATSRPDKVIGMHFFNPVHVLKVVEVIPGLETSRATVQACVSLCAAMGNEVGLAKDWPGFVANRILMPYINEAINLLAEGVASKEDIDKVVVQLSPKKMGPLATADLIGLDTCLSIMRVLHRDLGDDKYRPSPLLALYVSAGRLGKKTGRGFFTYEASS